MSVSQERNQNKTERKNPTFQYAILPHFASIATLLNQTDWFESLSWIKIYFPFIFIIHWHWNLFYQSSANFIPKNIQGTQLPLRLISHRKKCRTISLNRLFCSDKCSKFFIALQIAVMFECVKFPYANAGKHLSWCEVHLAKDIS